MPRLSDTMEEGKILKWLKKVGDKIEMGDIIAEVETDKADMEMEAIDAGVLAEIRVKEGESVPVNAVIAVLSEEGEEVVPVRIFPSSIVSLSRGISTSIAIGHLLISSQYSEVNGAVGTPIATTPAIHRRG